MAHIVVYTTASCPYCIAAKRLLNDKGAAFEEIKGFADLMKNHVEVMGKDVVIHLDTDTVVLEDTARPDLSRSDFLF